MEDLISRQSAIYKLFDAVNSFYGREAGRKEILEKSIELLNSLPSAQQEIIRCKDCKYNDLEEQNSTTRWLPCIDAAWPDDWFCGCAERRTDE